MIVSGYRFGSRAMNLKPNLNPDFDTRVSILKGQSLIKVKSWLLQPFRSWPGQGSLGGGSPAGSGDRQGRRGVHHHQYHTKKVLQLQVHPWWVFYCDFSFRVSCSVNYQMTYLGKSKWRQKRQGIFNPLPDYWYKNYTLAS